MGQITKNFRLEEFACTDGTPVPEELISNVKELAIDLQIIRDYFKKPIIINSSYRHESHNSNIGGSKTSMHLLAKAVDFKIEGVSNNVIQEKVLELMNNHTIKNGGLGRYNTFTHYDTRDYPARWDNRS